MKKIQLTENELKRMIVRVMEQMNTPSDENEPELFAGNYNHLLISHLKDMETIFDKIMDLSVDISEDKNLNPQDKEDLSEKCNYVIRELFTPLTMVTSAVILKW